MNPTKTVQEELQEVIKKNLPQQVGEELKKALEQGEKDAVQVVALRSQLLDMTDQRNRANTQLAEANEKLAKHTSLQSREEAVSKRERDAELQELKIKLESEVSKTQFSQNLLNSLVRNTEFRKTLFGDDTKVTQDNNGYSMTHSLPFNKTEITTEE